MRVVCVCGKCVFVCECVVCTRGWRVGLWLCVWCVCVLCVRWVCGRVCE